MIITFVSTAEQRTWLRLLELDGELCWQRAQRRRNRSQRRKTTPIADASPAASRS